MNVTPLSLTRISEIINRLDSPAVWTQQPSGAWRRQPSTSWFGATNRFSTRGMPSDMLHIVVSGQIKIFLPQPNGGEKVVALVAHGESFGVAPLWLGEAHMADAVANKHSYLLMLIARLCCARHARIASWRGG